MMMVLLGELLAFQSPREIPNRIECPRCTIQLTQVAILGSDLVEWPQEIGEDRQGRYYVTQPNKRELPAIFDAAGRRQGTLGGKGEGPGEFRLAAHIAIDPRTDSIFVTDWGTSRLSVFSPQGRFVRSFPFPTSASAIRVLRNQHLVAVARISDRATIGLPFHIFQRDGQRSNAIGDPSRPLTPGREVFFPHRVAASRRGGFWAVPQSGEYRIEHWTVSGVRDVYLRRRPTWHTALEPTHGSGDPLTMDFPPSMHLGVAEAENGYLWVVTRVADPKRRRAPLDTLRNVEGRYVTARSWDQVWDSVIELIDPARGTVVAAQRFDEMFHLMILPSGKVVHITETEAGIMARILKLSLSRGS
jgi:hypothetical protein